MSKSDFGTSGVLVAGIVATLMTFPYLGFVSIGGCLLSIATYAWFCKHINLHFKPDGSRKRKRKRH